ncbi:type II toxin-antitoxin system RelE/ParE family toxin [Puteibacter caeruleilacunae]|nr:type II toxin-antitoxin system RelE/ParE family toxin [Puteibacter caeruleilacunae]
MGRSKEKSSQAYSMRITKNALQNIKDITGYIAYIKHQPLNAIRVGDRIFEIIEKIEQNPLGFRECEEIPTVGKIYRKAVCMSWLIIYKIKDNEITILGVIHGSRKRSNVRNLRKIK